MTTNAGEVQDAPKHRTLSVFLIFTVPALGSLLFGYDIGATAFVIEQLQSPVYSGVSWHETVASTPFLVGLIVAIASIGAFVSSWIVFKLNDKIGRRQELRVGASLYMLGALIASISGYTPGTVASVTLLITGRFIYGCGIGFTMHAAPTYIAEMAPASIRGTLVSLKEAAIVFGILLGYVLGYALEHTVRGWVFQYASSIPVAVAVLVLSLTIPESARWLVLAEMPDPAKESLGFCLTDDHEIEREMHDMLEQQQQAENGRPHQNIFGRAMRAPLVAGIGLIVLQQVTGQPSVLSYATIIFESIGLGGLASVIVAAFKLVATLSAAITVEKFGRKSLLYVGCSLMLVALGTLVLSLSGTSDVTTEWRKVATLLAMFCYIGGYQVGFGPISWLMIGEVFPLSIRGQAVAFSVQMNFFLNFVVQLVVPLLQQAVGLSVTFGIFGVLTMYSLYFVHYHVPETKGLTLEEIEEQFRRQPRDAAIRHDSDGLESVPLLLA